MPVPEKKIFSDSSQGDSLVSRLSMITDELAAVKDRISAELVANSKLVDRRLEHVLSASGKMVRPGLVLLCGKCCGGAASSHIEIASIIEMVHVATLLHDDVIDHADSRRNIETANSIWGNETAVLLGDFMLSKAFAMSARLGNDRISEILADTAIQICQGELEQNAQRDNWHLSEGEYFEIIEAKTASLFGSSCELGALAGGGDSKTVQAFSDFGICLGMAFQVADDLIDIGGTEDAEGKTLGRDFAEGKPTLPMIHLMSTLKGDAADELETELAGGEKSDNFAKMLADSGSLEYSRQVARDYCSKAIGCLENVKACQAKELLIDIVAVVRNRAVSN